MNLTIDEIAYFVAGMLVMGAIWAFAAAFRAEEGRD